MANFNHMKSVGPRINFKSRFDSQWGVSVLRSGERRPATPGNKIYTSLMTFIRFSLYICRNLVSYANPYIAILGAVKKYFLSEQSGPEEG